MASEKYDVQMERAAEADLLGILDYISEVLREPVAAGRIYFSIKSKIATLDEMPLRNKLIHEEPFRSKGIRPLYVKNYTAFYTVDENKREVHILRVLYSHMQWQDRL